MLEERLRPNSLPITRAGPPRIAQAFDRDAALYAAFTGKSFAWRFIERPAFDKLLPDLYRADVRALDIGCGSGLVVQHLISRGLLPENIVGIDVSAKLLEKARRAIPNATFLQSSIDKFELPTETFDLVTANMVFHFVGNRTLKKALDRFYDVLKPDGVLFFVDTDPDHNLAGRLPENRNKWLLERTPWGTAMPYFNRDLADFVLDTIYFAGFDLYSGWLPPKVSLDGTIEHKEYLRYATRPSRIASRLHKVPRDVKTFRWETRHQKIPSLMSKHL